MMSLEFSVENIVPGAESGVATLAECRELFFDPPCSSEVLSEVNACSSIGVDRFVLSCAITQEEYGALRESLCATFQMKPMCCKHGRLRGLRAKISLHPYPKNSGCAAAHATVPLLGVPQVGARTVGMELQIYCGMPGHFFGVHGNGGFTPYQWQMFVTLLQTHFPKPKSIKVSRVEVRADYPMAIHDVAVIPIGLKSRFCMQDNGCYYGSRASNISYVIYSKHDAKEGSGKPPGPLTRVEARIRARKHPDELVDYCMNVFEKIGIYLVPVSCSMLHLPYAWRAADTRGRKRFLDATSSARLYVKPDQVALVLKEFVSKLSLLTW